MTAHPAAQKHASRHISLPVPTPADSHARSASPQPFPFPRRFALPFVDPHPQPDPLPADARRSPRTRDSLDLPSTSDFDTATLSMLDHVSTSGVSDATHAAVHAHALSNNRNEASPSLSAFADLPHYPFDFDYRGHTLRAPLLRAPTPPYVDAVPARSTVRAGYAHQNQNGYAHDFQSYMFPEVDESASACVSFEDDDDDTVTDSTTADENKTHTRNAALKLRKLAHHNVAHHNVAHPHRSPTLPPLSSRTLSSQPSHEAALTRAPRTRTRARSSGHSARPGGGEDNRRRRADGADAGDADAIDWDTVRQAQLSFADGTPLSPERLYTGYCSLTILLLLPRESIETCALVYAKVAHLLQQVSTRLVFVTPWSPDQASKFLARFERIAPFPGSLVCDAGATLFSAFGLTRSPFQALFASNALSAPIRQGVRNALSAVTYRAANRDIGSTAVPSKRLKAGTVVLKCLRGYSKIPDVVYSQTESVSTGVGCYLDVLTVTGVNDAFVPDIDVAQLLTRFNCMRVTSLKARYADMKDSSSHVAQHRQHQTHSQVSDQQSIGNSTTHSEVMVPPSERRSSRKGDRRNALKT